MLTTFFFIRYQILHIDLSIYTHEKKVFAFKMPF